jgi:hypothetical protein
VLSGKENETAMRCARYNKLIYLYDELEGNEKKDVDAHLQTCQHCRFYFEQQQSEQRFLKSIFRSPSMPVDSLLTNRIMAAIPMKSIRKIDSIELTFGFLQRSSIRYALASISVLLCVFFISELRPMASKDLNIAWRNDPNAIHKNAKLNSANLYELTGQSNGSSAVFTHSKTLSLYECISGCRNGNYENCKECKTKHLNFKGYEGI